VILIAFGTRPEYIKLKPIIDIFKKERQPYKILFTGQHTSLLPAEATVEIDLTLNIKDGSNRLDSIVGSVMNQSHIWIEQFTHVMVQGDTSSAFAVALAAFHRKVPVIHLEAGLRTYDNNNPYPEEFNRQAISRLANIHLCPTTNDAKNLRREKAQGEIYVVGNTVLDNLKDLQVSYNNKILITMHRRENHDKIEEWFTAFDNLAKSYLEYDFEFVSHPNPNVQKHLHLLGHVKTIEPMEHNKFIKEVAQCRFLITDSGGLQEESSFLRKRSVVCRKATERTAGLGHFSVLCYNPSELYDMIPRCINNFKISSAIKCPYGDGNSAEKIYNALNSK